MIIIKVLGGLGNQLYQYALYEALKAAGREALLDISAYLPKAKEPERRLLELSKFPNVTYETASQKEINRLLDISQNPAAKLRRAFTRFRNKDAVFGKIYKEQEGFCGEVFEREDCYLDGFWQNERYFAGIWPALVEKLEFPLDGLDFVNRENLRNISKERSVGIHIRRTDYVDKDHEWRYGGICTLAYYQKAVEYAGKADHYYLFTDDPLYALQNAAKILPQGTKFTLCDWNQGAHSFFDMMLMAACSVMICANSSFSCWGARLPDPLRDGREKWLPDLKMVGKSGGLFDAPVKREEPDPSEGSKEKKEEESHVSETKLKIRPFKMDNTQTRSLETVQEDWSGWVFIDEIGKIRSSL